MPTNMTDPTITCPACKADIKLTESLAPLIETFRQQSEQQIAAKESAIAKREAGVRAELATLAKERDSLDVQVAEKLKNERQSIAAEEAKKARQQCNDELEQKSKELSELHDAWRQRGEKLAEAQKAQADLVRMQRELEDAKSAMDLTIERKVQESLSAARDQAKAQAEEGLKLKVMEKEETIKAMQKQIEELKHKAEQGSERLRGEVQELDLQMVLKEKFPRDSIEPVPKGEFGGDILQRVIGPSQQICGTILWESKRTKNWSDGWLAKLRDDQRAAKAELAVIVTQVLPKNVAIFDLVDGIWVTSPSTLVPVGLALRQSLVELAQARQAAEGQQTKMELVYQYLMSPKFRHRIQATVEKITEMQADLDKERKLLMRMWSKREALIQGVIASTMGMYGDLQGIAGKTLQEIEGLEPRLLEASDTSEVGRPSS